MDRLLALATALALGATVALHAVSRNSQLLLAILLMAAVLCRYRSIRAALSGLGAALLLVAVMWQLSPTTQVRFGELVRNLQVAKDESNYGTSGGVRLRMFQEAFQGMVDHPVIGTGVGSWLPHWRGVWKTLEGRVAPEAREMFSAINNPHNDFLLSGMETGVIGLLILVWLLLRFIVQGWRRCSTAGGVSVVLGVAIVVTAMVNAPFRDAALGMTLLWLLAASAAGVGVGGRAVHA